MGGDRPQYHASQHRSGSVCDGTDFDLEFPLSARPLWPGGLQHFAPEHPSRQGVEGLQQSFGIGETVPILLAVSSATPQEPILSSAHIATLFQLVNELKRDSRVADVYSLFNLDPKLNLAVYQKLYQRPDQLPPPLATALKQLSSPSTTLIILKSWTGSNNADSQALVEKLKGLSPARLRLQVGGGRLPVN